MKSERMRVSIFSLVVVSVLLALAGCNSSSSSRNPLEPETLEYKYFAPGVGLVKEEVLDSGESAELI